MKEEVKQGYVAGIISLFIGIVIAIMSINMGWNMSGQVMGAFGVLFTLLGIGSLLKPEGIGAITSQLLENISRNVEDGEGDRKQVQSGTDRSAQAYTEKGDVHIEQHFHDQKKDDESYK